MLLPLVSKARLPLNIWILALTFSLAMTGISLLLFVGGIIGKALAPSDSLATLPVVAFVCGSAVMAIPAALLLQKIGRRSGTYFGLTLSLCSALCGVVAVNLESFYWLVFTGFCIGLATPFYQQFRFAAIESLHDKSQTGPALSTLMLFTIGGALLGPEFGTFGQELLGSTAPFTGSFMLFGLCIILAMAVFFAFENPAEPHVDLSSAGRPLWDIVRQPVFLVALASAALGYAVMSYLMTSTPLSMHEHHGYTLEAAKWVIQSHLVAMFFPSLFSGLLLQRFGPGLLMLAGALLYLAVALIALSGEAVMHYWWSLVLLGVGWNFLYLSGTSLLPRSYTHIERFKTQAVNDFLIFTVQGVGSLSAAWVLFGYGWNVQILTTLPVIMAIMLAAIYGILRLPNINKV